jgi:hypothetical protein
MNDAVARVFLDLVDDYDKFIASPQDKQHFHRWCTANAPVLAARVMTELGKVDATQKEENNGSEQPSRKGRTRRKTAADNS